MACVSATSHIPRGLKCAERKYEISHNKGTAHSAQRFYTLYTPWRNPSTSLKPEVGQIFESCKFFILYSYSQSLSPARTQVRESLLSFPTFTSCAAPLRETDKLTDHRSKPAPKCTFVNLDGRRTRNCRFPYTVSELCFLHREFSSF
jgi:hypothetical protein